ncbi:MAG: DUF167 domain-containing protein [Thermodesulfobacteriota bacterium]|nr:DUF167 domain-containing protein [Thermodesulfobacteriota bacterium]
MKGTPDQVKTDIKVKLLPRSSKNGITFKEGVGFKVKVTAPPIDGMANKALIELLAKRLRIPKGNIEIISGKSSRLKHVQIRGLSLVDISTMIKKC